MLTGGSEVEEEINIQLAPLFIEEEEAAANVKAQVQRNEIPWIIRF